MMKKRFARMVLKPIFNFFIPDRHAENAKASFHDLYDSFGELGKNKMQLTLISAFTALIWLITIFQIQLIGLTTGISIDYTFLLVVMSIVVIIELIPISIFGFGTREAFLIFALGLIGIASESVIAFSISYIIIAYWTIGLVGLLFWIRDPVKLKM